MLSPIFCCDTAIKLLKSTYALTLIIVFRKVFTKFKTFCCLKKFHSLIFD